MTHASAHQVHRPARLTGLSASPHLAHLATRCTRVRVRGAGASGYAGAGVVMAWPLRVRVHPGSEAHPAYPHLKVHSGARVRVRVHRAYPYSQVQVHSRTRVRVHPA